MSLDCTDWWCKQNTVIVLTVLVQDVQITLTDCCNHTFNHERKCENSEKNFWEKYSVDNFKFARSLKIQIVDEEILTII